MFNKRFEFYKLRHAVRKTLRDWKVQITQQERDLEQRRSELDRARETANSHVDTFNNNYLRFMESNLRNMEQSLADMKINYSRFVKEQARPSPGLPNGITFESFSV